MTETMSGLSTHYSEQVVSTGVLLSPSGLFVSGAVALAVMSSPPSGQWVRYPTSRYEVVQTGASKDTYDICKTEDHYFIDDEVRDLNIDYKRSIVEFFVELAKCQQPLGEEFEKVWNENAFDLYES